MKPSHRVWLYKKLSYIFQVQVVLTAQADASELVINELSKGCCRCTATENSGKTCCLIIYVGFWMAFKIYAKPWTTEATLVVCI